MTRASGPGQLMVAQRRGFGRARRSAFTVFVALPLLALAWLVAGPGVARAGSGYVPAQFVAKQYSEGLGRIPDAPGWRSALGFFGRSGCTAQSLASFGEAVYTSPEFTGLGYGDAARLLALTRGALNREPDAKGFKRLMERLHAGASWASVVDEVFTGAAFKSLVPRICSGVVDGSRSSYYLGTAAPLSIPSGGHGFAGNERALQARLDAAAARGGGTVALAQRALVMLDTPLTVPEGVTLTTVGAPDPRRYADMARLVRAPSMAAPASLTALVRLKGGAKLTSVWVDGARDVPGNKAPLEDVITYGGGVEVSSDRISNSQGPNTLYLFGGFNGFPCASASVTGNLITAYSSDHYLNGDWTDGIAINCEGATVTGNEVIDATDVGIVVYRNTVASPQHSVVRNNSVLSAGNSAYGGLVFDPLYESGRVTPKTFGFTGATIQDNTLWTGPDTHFEIAISNGTRAWFAGRASVTADTGTGGSVIGNTTGALSARVQTGIATAGMLHTTVTGNTLRLQHISAGRCPKLDDAAELGSGHASGTFDPAPRDVAFDGCM
ncbi:MAG: hypothetical protein P8Z81_03630 [Deinococcales bacterium]